MALDFVLSNYNKITGAHMITSKSFRNNLEYLGIKATYDAFVFIILSIYRYKLLLGATLCDFLLHSL
jgi:hypothetical protein